MSALDTQEGGSHYKHMKIQPVEFVHANGLGFIEGSIVKYVSRHRNKNGEQDLRKARHFIDMLLELEYGQELEKAAPQVAKVAKVAEVEHLPYYYVQRNVVRDGDIRKAEPSEEADMWSVYMRCTPDAIGYRLSEWHSDHDTEAEALEVRDRLNRELAWP